MADWSAIRSAIAAKAAGVSGIREGTSTKLQGVTMTPCVKVTHVSDVQMTDRGAGYEFRTATIRGHLLVAKTADVGRAMDDVETYTESLTVAFRTGIVLGLAGTVQDSYLDTWEAGAWEYAGIEFAGAALVWKVLVRENVTRSSS